MVNSSRAAIAATELPAASSRGPQAHRVPSREITAKARQFTDTFTHWYNHEHRHTGIGLHTPADVHFGLATDKAADRRTALTQARARHPHRFGTVGAPRSSTYPTPPGSTDQPRTPPRRPPRQPPKHPLDSSTLKNSGGIPAVFVDAAVAGESNRVGGVALRASISVIGGCSVSGSATRCDRRVLRACSPWRASWLVTPDRALPSLAECRALSYEPPEARSAEPQNIAGLRLDQGPSTADSTHPASRRGDGRRCTQRSGIGTLSSQPSPPGRSEQKSIPAQKLLSSMTRRSCIRKVDTEVRRPGRTSRENTDVGAGQCGAGGHET